MVFDQSGATTGPGPYGPNTSAEGEPVIVKDTSKANVVAVVFSQDRIIRFNDHGNYTYSVRNCNPDDYSLIWDGDHCRFTFHDNCSSQTTYNFEEVGGFAEKTDDGGNSTVVSARTPEGDIAEITRTAIFADRSITEFIRYTYVEIAPEQRQIASITYGRRANPSAEFRRTLYDYYAAGEAHGNLGDLKTVTQQIFQNGAWHDHEVTYYRYYKPGEAGGFEHGLKYKLGPAAFQRLKRDPQVASPFTASDEKVAQYADNYYEYDNQQRATKAAVRGGLLTYTYTYTTSEFEDNANHWHLKTVTTNPDGTQEIVFANYLAQVMLRDFTDGTNHWIDYSLYDNDGRVIEQATPAAIDMSGTPYDEGEADLDVQLNTDAGLIHVTDYYASTTATESVAGGIAGHVESTKIKEGSGGTQIKQSQTKYFKRTVNGSSSFPVAESIVFRDTAGTEPITTAYEYEWYPDQVQVKQRTTLLPIVPEEQNGTGQQESRVEILDSFNRVAWSKDARGFITYRGYNDLTGAVVQEIQDVDMSKMSGVPLHPGWTTPPGGGLHLVTDYEHDELGRGVQTLGPPHDSDGQSVRHASWTVYNDLEDETLSAQGYVTGAVAPYQATLVNPVSIQKTAEDGRFSRSVAAVRQVTSGKLTAGDSFPQSSWVRWSESFSNRYGQQTHSRTYHCIPDCGAGEEGANYSQTAYGYDVMDRQNRTRSPGGTITRTVFDSRGQAIETWIGTADDGATANHPNGVSDDIEANAPGNNMKRVASQVYDDGQDGGNGNLTESIEHVDGNPANDRATGFQYDFRNRQTVTDGEVDFYQANFYDNLGHVIQVQRRDTTSGGNLIAQSQTLFDNRGRVYRTLRYAVDPSTGTVGNALADNTFYDPDGNVVQSQPSGSQAFNKSNYDGLGRQVVSYVGYAAESQSSSSSSSSGGGPVGADVIFEQSETTYDAASNVIAAASLSRYHDATGAGELVAGENARPSYTANYFDGAGRQIAAAVYGNQGDDSLPFVRPESVPESSDLVLVSLTRYNDRGEAFETVDAAGVANRSLFDAAGRTVCTIQNYIADSACNQCGDSCSCESGEDSLTVQPGESENVVTQMTYNADGNLLKLTAKNPATGDQNTIYAYGTTLEDSGVASNSLLRAEIYPDTADGQDQVTYAYNRQGQVTEKTDQNGTVHRYDYDKLGRQTDDKVVTLAAGVDDAVQRISQTFEVRGGVKTITSHNAPTGGSVVNEVENEYNDFAQLETQYQEHDGSVNAGSTVKVQYGYADGSANTIRPESVTYPNGRELEYLYDDEAADKLSRVRTLRWDGTNVCRYGYLGLGAFVEVDYLQPGVQYTLATGPANSYSGLDRFGRIVDLLWRHNSTPLVHLQYGYDRVSNRTFRKDNVARSYGKHFDELYEYDRLHRLKKFHRGLLVENNSVIESPALQQGWLLDSTGNWRNFTQNDQQDPAKALDQQRSHNQVNEITEIARTVGQQWATPAYDRNGNMTVIPQPKEMDKTYQATWDAWNRLVKLEQEEENHSSSSSSSSSSDSLVLVAQYAYNGLNWRIKKTTAEETRHFYYSSAWQCLDERIAGQSGSSSSSSSSSTPETTVDRQYVWGLRYIDDLVLRDRSNAGMLEERLYALQDANWNVVAVIDTAVEGVERYAYSAYGDIQFLNASFVPHLVQESIVDQCYTFTGRYRYAATAILYIRERDYSAQMGRFLSRDPIGYDADDVSLYEYTHSRPLTLSDPTGLQANFNISKCNRYRRSQILAFAEWLKRILERRNDCWKFEDSPCECRAQLRQCVLTILESPLKFTCPANLIGMYASSFGDCIFSKTGGRPAIPERNKAAVPGSADCSACSDGLLKNSIIRIKGDSFVPERLSMRHESYQAYEQYFRGLVLHEVLHLCVGDHKDPWQRPDAKTLAMEFMAKCGGGWAGTKTGPITAELPPNYRPKTVERFRE